MELNLTPFFAVCAVIAIAFALSFFARIRAKQRQPRPLLFWDEDESLGFLHLADLVPGEEITVCRHTEDGLPIVLSNLEEDPFILRGIKSTLVKERSYVFQKSGFSLKPDSVQLA